MEKLIGTTDVAKIIRKKLRSLFPKQDFSVISRKYSGGSSIDVRWVDGVATEKVEKEIKEYSGSGFDGMQDLKYSKDNPYLVDYVFAERRYSQKVLDLTWQIMCEKFAPSVLNDFNQARQHFWKMLQETDFDPSPVDTPTGGNDPVWEHHLITLREEKGKNVNIKSV